MKNKIMSIGKISRTQMSVQSGLEVKEENPKTIMPERPLV